MKSVDRLNEFYHELTPLSEMCINCIFFVRHYVHQDKDNYIAIFDGHCRNGRLKRCKVYDVCAKFTNKFYDDFE